ncbi:hypothetical protein Syun_025909 [Stephania yunnanensis]|uniref:Uncharacterized protein n=1 Tax=Stephania yunnanensis TaxID=152371 RepID=A0AAP0HVQ8_9MAGN
MPIGTVEAQSSILPIRRKTEVGKKNANRCREGRKMKEVHNTLEAKATAHDKAQGTNDEDISVES